jgi:thiamine-monophosphate kinase
MSDRSAVPPGSVGELGEFGLIDRFVGRLGDSGAALLGNGDDAAVLAAPDGRVVVSTDSLLEGRHFRRDWSTAEDVGHKAAAQAIADIAAMGAVPTGVVVALGLPAALPADWTDGLADGLRDECARAGTTVVGGDVIRSELVTITLTALGDLGGADPVTRTGARPGDVVAVAGRLGWSAAGLLVLSRGFRSPLAVVSAHRRPEPPYAEGPRAAELGATAMCDVSDGLIQDLRHIAAGSNVGIELDSSRFTVPDKLRDVAGALGADPLTWLLEGGEDHALVATFPATVSLPDTWRQVGRVTKGAGVAVDGTPRHAGGYDHFA